MIFHKIKTYQQKVHSTIDRQTH